MISMFMLLMTRLGNNFHKIRAIQPLISSTYYVGNNICGEVGLSNR